MAKEDAGMKRREFLRKCAWAAAGLSLLPRVGGAAETGAGPENDADSSTSGGKPMNKTVLSFFCDDTSPWRASPSAFGDFLDYVQSEGIAGESSVILALGSGGRVLSEPRSDAERA